MVLMAICDARRCFTLIDVGEYGTNNDSGVLKNSQMGKMFQREEMNVPGMLKKNIKIPPFWSAMKSFP